MLEMRSTRHGYCLHPQLWFPVREHFILQPCFYDQVSLAQGLLVQTCGFIHVPVWWESFRKKYQERLRALMEQYGMLKSEVWYMA